VDKQFKLKVAPDGIVTAIYSDSLVDLLAEGRTEIKRVSAVEPTSDGNGWLADLAVVNGPVLGPFPLRAEALAAEVAWLEDRLF
jgi:hypothetical protein